MKVEDVSKLLNEKKKPRLPDLVLAYLVLAYLESHPDEVFRPMDKEELAAKVGWPTPGAVPHALIELTRKGLISWVRVKQYIIYGKRETIENLRKRLPEEVTLTKRELARRRLSEGGSRDATADR